MKGYQRKILVVVGVVPLIILFNEYYLKKKNTVEKTYNQKEVVIKVESKLDASAPQAEFKALSKKVSKRSTQADLLNKVQNFSKKIEEILPSLKEDWQKEGKSILIELEKCQNDDYCGMEPDEDGYFDESETHARKHQVRLLDMLNKAYQDNHDDKFLLDSGALNGFLDSENDRLINASLEQLHYKGELKDSLEKLSGDASARALVFLAKKKVSDDEMGSYIETALSNADGFTAVRILEEMEKLNFDESGFESALKRTCHLKSGMPQNWKAIVALSKGISKQRKMNPNAETVCK